MHSTETATAWGNESLPRQQLFNLAIGYTDPGDWILWLDADMVPARSPRALMDGSSDAWAFVLYDLWSEKHYREDAFWQGHLHPRIWMIRRPEPQDWVWNARGIHCGHLPANFHVAKGMGIAPYDMGLLHYAYSDPSLRHFKISQYLSVHKQLTPHELKHAQSIMDPAPRIVPLYFKPELTLTLEPNEQRAAA